MSYRKFYEVGEDKNGEKYSQMLVFDDEGFNPDKSSCTCPFGSYYGHSQKNKGKLCKHLREALRLENENGNMQGLQKDKKTDKA